MKGSDSGKLLLNDPISQKNSKALGVSRYSSLSHDRGAATRKSQAAKMRLRGSINAKLLSESVDYANNKSVVLPKIQKNAEQ